MKFCSVGHIEDLQVNVCEHHSHQFCALTDYSNALPISQQKLHSFQSLKSLSHVEELKEGLRDLKRTRTPQEDQQSTNLDPWGLPETEPPTKELPWARPSLSLLIHIYVADVQLGLCECPQQLELNLFPVRGTHSPNWAPFSGLSGRGCTQSCT